MTLGEKLRRARQEAGLSQRQLCGEEITRNMLSQIENGSARPSMTTLQYLAHRLGLPVSFFLEEEAAVTSNRSCMDSAWEAFERGDYSLALASLEDYRSPDPLYDREKAMLHPMVLLSLAQASIDAGREPYARKLLNQVQMMEARVPWLPELRARRILLLRRLGEPVPVEMLPELDEWLLLHARGALDGGEPARTVQLLDACRRRGADWALLRGKAALALGDNEAAADFLREAEPVCPKEVIPLLEQTYRELGDFKSAYEYACKARGDKSR